MKKTEQVWIQSEISKQLWNRTMEYVQISYPNFWFKKQIEACVWWKPAIKENIWWSCTILLQVSLYHKGPICQFDKKQNHVHLTKLEKFSDDWVLSFLSTKWSFLMWKSRNYFYFSENEGVMIWFHEIWLYCQKKYHLGLTVHSLWIPSSTK